MMAIAKLNSIAWCNSKESWAWPQLTEEARRVLRPLRAVRPPEPMLSLQELIDNSNRFPIPFPVHTMRLEKLKATTPAERLVRNAASTYPIMHERVPQLMANFLLYKRKYGSNIEKELYKDMSIPQLIDRILQKRAISFMKAQDQYLLITGEKGTDGWESVGTDQERPPLLLARVLSYDEIKLAALVCVSGYTECINDGHRKNAGVPTTEGVHREAVIIGVIGPRFKRVNRMEYEDIVVTAQQNTEENGYGKESNRNDAKRAYRQLWADFYKLPNLTHEELLSTQKIVPCTGARVFTERWAKVKAGAFDNVAYYRRLQLLLELAMVEASARAHHAGKHAFLNIIGAGLGVWKMSPHQVDIFVLATLECANNLLEQGRVQNLAVINLAYIKPGKEVLGMFTTKKQSNSDDGEEPAKILVLGHDLHPKRGIEVQLQNREPSAELGGAHAGLLLVLTYPWDGNAHPGNEFWLGKLGTSGDPAAACATQVAELHNARVNPAPLAAANARLAARTVRPLNQHFQLTETTE